MEATVGNLIIELRKDLILIREKVSGDLLKCREVSPCTAVENFQDLVKALKKKRNDYENKTRISRKNDKRYS